MTSFRLLFITFSAFLLNHEGNAQNNTAEWVIPSPLLFVYEGKSSEPDKWYGIITLLSETDLQGIWLRMIFDRPPLQMGNWFGEVVMRNSTEYLVKNRNMQLTARVPQTIQFYIKYNPSEPTPKLVSFRLNGKTVSPEGDVTDAPPPVTMEFASGDTSSTANRMGSGGSGGAGNNGGGGSGGERPLPAGEGGGGGGGNFFGLPTSGSGEDEFYPGDFYNFFNGPNNQQTPQDNGDINAICGTVVVQPKPLITQGQATEEGEFPWHAALYRSRGIDLVYICGASLVSKYHVLTVAHCVTKSRSPAPVNPDSLVVYLGKYYLKRFSSTGVQDLEVSMILPHPQYNPQTYGNDIALVKFTTPAEFTDSVRPVCLWQESPDISSVLNKHGNVVGWGFDETSKLTATLEQAKMSVVSQETCISSYPEFYSRFMSSNTYCAGFRNGTSVCTGDSGGGMVFPKPNSNRNKLVWQLRGLVSINAALQNRSKCDSSHFVVFTDSAKYLDWIKKSMAV